MYYIILVKGYNSDERPFTNRSIFDLNLIILTMLNKTFNLRNLIDLYFSENNFNDNNNFKYDIVFISYN